MVFLSVRLASNVSFTFVRRTRPRDVVVFAATCSRCTVHTFAMGDVSCLLGPVGERELTRTVRGFRELATECNGAALSGSSGRLLGLLGGVDGPRGGCHAHFLVSKSRGLCALRMRSVTCFCSRGGVAFTIAGRKGRRVVSLSLSGLSRRLGPSVFFHAGQRALIDMRTVRGVRGCFLKGVVMRMGPPFGSGVAMDERGVTTVGL